MKIVIGWAKIFTTGEIEIDQINYLPNEHKKASSWAKLVSFNLGAEFLKKIYQQALYLQRNLYGSRNQLTAVVINGFYYRISIKIFVSH